MSDKITETLILEVTGVSQQAYYSQGYSKPAENLTMLRLTHNINGNDSLRRAEITIPGNLPLGTRFKLELSQIDDVTEATIRRGALPIIEDRRLIEGEVN